jgi:hypothetical protein
MQGIFVGNRRPRSQCCYYYRIVTRYSRDRDKAIARCRDYAKKIKAFDDAWREKKRRNTSYERL